MADARAGSAHTYARVRVPPSVRPSARGRCVRGGGAGGEGPAPGQQRVTPPLPARPAPGPAHSSGTRSGNLEKNLWTATNVMEVTVLVLVNSSFKMTGFSE